MRPAVRLLFVLATLLPMPAMAQGDDAFGIQLLCSSLRPTVFFLNIENEEAFNQAQGPVEEATNHECEEWPTFLTEDTLLLSGSVKCGGTEVIIAAFATPFAMPQETRLTEFSISTTCWVDPQGQPEHHVSTGEILCGDLRYRVTVLHEGEGSAVLNTSCQTSPNGMQPRG